METPDDAIPSVQIGHQSASGYPRRFHFLGWQYGALEVRRGLGRIPAIMVVHEPGTLLEDYLWAQCELGHFRYVPPVEPRPTDEPESHITEQIAAIRRTSREQYRRDRPVRSAQGREPENPGSS